MIDDFVLLLTHGLLVMAALRLLARPDIDLDVAPAQTPPGEPTPSRAAARGVVPALSHGAGRHGGALRDT